MRKINKTRCLIFHALTITVLVVLYATRPFGMISSIVWSAYLAVMYPYNGFRVTLGCLFLETIILTGRIYTDPMLLALYNQYPVVLLFGGLFVLTIFAFVSFYVTAQVVDVRKYVERIFDVK